MTQFTYRDAPGDDSTELADLFDRATVDRLLTTTRSVRRRLDLDRPVEPEVIEECLELAVQAPVAHNVQNWRWIVVTDAEKRRQIAELYKIGWHYYAGARGNQRRRVSRQGSQARMQESAQWLNDNIHAVPVHVIACQMGRVRSNAYAHAVATSWAEISKSMNPVNHVENSPDAWLAEAQLVQQLQFFGSIFPAIWSFQLALRSRGLGTVITANHMPFESHAAEVLGIPSSVTQVALLPVAYTIGHDFRPAPRTPARGLTYWNTWGEARLEEDGAPDGPALAPQARRRS